MQKFSEYHHRREKVQKQFDEMVEFVVQNNIDLREFAKTQLNESGTRNLATSIGAGIGSLGGPLGTVAGGLVGAGVGHLANKFANKGRAPAIAPLYQQAAQSLDALVKGLQGAQAHAGQNAPKLEKLGAAVSQLHQQLNKYVKPQTLQSFDQQINQTQNAAALQKHQQTGGFRGWLGKMGHYAGRAVRGYDNFAQKHPLMAMGVNIAGGVGAGAAAHGVSNLIQGGWGGGGAAAAPGQQHAPQDMPQQVTPQQAGQWGTHPQGQDLAPQVTPTQAAQWGTHPQGVDMAPGVSPATMQAQSDAATQAYAAQTPGYQFGQAAPPVDQAGQGVMPTQAAGWGTHPQGQALPQGAMPPGFKKT